MQRLCPCFLQTKTGSENFHFSRFSRTKHGGFHGVSPQMIHFNGFFDGFFHQKPSSYWKKPRPWTLWSFSGRMRYWDERCWLVMIYDAFKCEYIYIIYILYIYILYIYIIYIIYILYIYCWLNPNISIIFTIIVIVLIDDAFTSLISLSKWWVRQV